MFVDEVEVEKSVHISRRRNVADRIPMVGISQPGKDVPRCRDSEKQQSSRKDAQFAPASPLSCQHQVGDDGGEEEDGCNQTLCQ